MISGRINQEACRKLQVAVVLQHACVAYVGLGTSVEVVELYHVERHGKLNSAVAAEVEQDNAVAVNDLAYRLAVLGNYECRKILIACYAGLSAQSVQRVHRGRELSALAAYVRVPAALYHRPVSLVAVHCDLHTSAAACYPALECAVVQFLEQILELLDVDLRSLRGNVTAVQQGVYSYLGDTIGLSLLYHVEQVLDVGMYVAVGQQTDEMHGGVLALYVSSQFLPCVGFVHLAALDALVNELCALRVDLTAADRVVTYLGVAMSSSDGRPTASPCALRRVLGQLASIQSRVGVLASPTASPRWVLEKPTPSITTNNIGFFAFIEILLTNKIRNS